MGSIITRLLIASALNLTQNIVYCFFQATVELQGYKTRGQLVLEKRGKSYTETDLRDRGEINDARKAGVVEVVLSVDAERLKDSIFQAFL